METVLHFDDDVQSFYATDMTRIPAQKIHNYRSDLWIALNCFSLVSGGCFTLRNMESLVDADDMRSGHTTDTTRVPAQKVHNCRSDRWIALKCFSLVFGGYFTWSSVELVLHDDDVQSGHTADTTRVPAQKVHNYRFDHWIALKCFHEFA